MKHLKSFFSKLKIGDCVKFKDDSTKYLYIITSISKSTSYASYKKDSYAWSIDNIGEDIPGYYMYEICDIYDIQEDPDKHTNWWENENKISKVEDYEIDSKKYNL